MDDIDGAALQLQEQVMDDLAEYGWDHVTCARVLMNLSQRLDRMADRVIEMDALPYQGALEGMET